MIESDLNKSVVPILTGIILSIFLLNFISSSKDSELKLDELALGEDNKNFLGIENKNIIHCSDLRDLKDCSDSYKNIGDKMPVVLWLGNSQLHAINQPKDDDEVAPLHLHRKLKKFSMFTLAFSQPNANLQEHFLLYAHLLDKFPIQTLILPIVFDDMREDDLRPSIYNILDDEKTLEIINSTFTGKKLIYLKKKEKKDVVSNYKNFKDNSYYNNYFEKKINYQLGSFWSVWDNRDSLRGKFFSSLYKIRNTVFNINEKTTRKIIRGPYVKNLKALKDILDLSIEKKIKVLVYIPPLRNDIKIPYDVNEYSNFKVEVKSITDNYKFKFISFENIIQKEFWGFKNSTNLKKKKEIDFMHFKGEGHKLLSEALFLEVIKIIEN